MLSSMANRMKEDEKNEKIIRGLLKLPGNRRCINCNSLGPQYVCTNFWTFVCTTCSGIHREFTHRVKSVSMAKFTSQEVASLQNGGNERAKEIYLKDWDQHHNSFPDSSNVDRLRDFIRHVYEGRRYTGERVSDRSSRVDREDSNKQHSASQSPPSEDTYEQNYGVRPGLGGRNEDRNSRNNYDGRSPGYDQDKQKYGDYKRNPAQFEAGDDIYRDDRPESRRSEDSKFSCGEPKLEDKSLSYQKALGSSSPPVLRPVRDILGENIPIRIVEPPKVNGSKAPVGSMQTQRTASSSSTGSVDGNPADFKNTNLGSLIDFTSDPDPPSVATGTQTQNLAASTFQAFTPTNSSFAGDNWASFDSPVQEKGSQVSSSGNTLGSVVSQLSVPTTSPVKMPTLPPSGSAAVLTPVTTAVPAVGGGNSSISSNNLQWWSHVQQPQHSPFPISDNQITAQPTNASVGGGSNDQTWSTLHVSNVQRSMSTPTLPLSQSASELIQDIRSGEVSRHPLEAKSGGRKALPEDLFTATYSSFPQWQAQPYGMGFGMQYPTAMLQHAPTFPQASRSINPFDVSSGAALVQPPVFPSMASLQGALPNASTPTGLLQTSSFGTPMHHPQWVPSQTQAYPPSMPPQPLPYVSGVPQSMYLGQQMHSNLPHPVPQAVGGFGRDGVAFGPLSTNQQQGGRFSAPSTPNSFSSVGGNPFS